MSWLSAVGLQNAMAYLAVGAIVGFLAGLLGVGGGGIVVPVLAAMFVSQSIGGEQYIQYALATSLACMMFTTASSAWAHHRHHAVAWRVAKGLMLGVIIGSVIGTQLAVRLSDVVLALIFAGFMGLASVQMFVGWQPKPSDHPIHLPTSIAVGSIIGALSTLLSIGGALFTVIYLVYKNIDIKKAVGTSSAVGLSIAIFGTLGYVVSGSHMTELQRLNAPSYALGYVYVPAFILVTLASILCAPLGANISHKLPNKQLKRIFGLLCLLMSLRMLWVAITAG